MKKSQNTRTYVGQELKKLINENGDAIIKANALRNIKAIKLVSEVDVTGTQFEMLMSAIGGINVRINQMDAKFTKRLDKVDQRLDNIEKDVKELKTDVAAIKNTPTMKRELK